MAYQRMKKIFMIRSTGNFSGRLLQVMKFWKLFKKSPVTNDFEKFFPLRLDIGESFIESLKEFVDEDQVEDDVEDILELYGECLSIYSDITL